MAEAIFRKNMMHEIRDIKKTVTIMKKELEFIKGKFELEEKDWNKLAEKGFGEVWDNKKDDKVWQKYL